MLECEALHDLPERKGEAFEMTSKRQIKLSMIGWAILFAIAVILGLIGLPFWYAGFVILVSGIVMLVAGIVFAQTSLRTLNSIPQPLPRLELQTDLVYNRDNQSAFAVITNTGEAPVQVGCTEVHLTYSTMFGPPALGGNGLDGLSLAPAPIISTLSPGETRKIEIFGPDRQLEIAQQHVSSYAQKVADEVTAAGSVLKFLQQDKSGIFSIMFRVRWASGAAWLPSERLQA
jgi:hypothetical protein